MVRLERRSTVRMIVVPASVVTSCEVLVRFVRPLVLLVVLLLVLQLLMLLLVVLSPSTRIRCGERFVSLVALLMLGIIPSGAMKMPQPRRVACMLFVSIVVIVTCVMVVPVAGMSSPRMVVVLLLVCRIHLLLLFLLLSIFVLWMGSERRSRVCGRTCLPTVGW